MARSRKLKSTGESLAQVESRRDAEESLTVEQKIAALTAEIARLKKPAVPTFEEVEKTKLAVVVNGVGILVNPIKFQKGSYGYSLSNRSVDMTVAGVKGTLTVGVCAVFKGSKPVAQ